MFPLPQTLNLSAIARRLIDPIGPAIVPSTSPSAIRYWPPHLMSISTRRAALLLASSVALAILVCIGLWMFLDGHATPAGSVQEAGVPRQQTANDHPAPEPVREAVDPFPDGRIWLRATSWEGAPDTLAFTWSKPDQRWILPGLRSVADPDGWWKVELPSAHAAAAGDDALAVMADGCAVEWIQSPDVAKRYEIALTPLIHFVELVDIDRGERVVGARIRLSAAPMAGAAWLPDSRPGIDLASAIYHSVPHESGCYLVNGLLGEDHRYRFEIEHPLYVVAPGAPSILSRSAGWLRIGLQMPLVASIRYVGDELLDARIRIPGSVADAGTRARLDAIRSALVARHEPSLTAVFLRDVDPAGVLAPDADPLFIRATALFRHGERRADEVPAVRLADFEGPIEVHVDRPGDAAMLTEVTIAPPPRFQGVVEGSFKVLLSGGRDFRPRVVKLGDTIELPPGEYLVTGAGDHVSGALAPTTYTVRAGEPTRFDLQWRDGTYLYQVDLGVPPGVAKVHFICGEEPGRFVLDCGVDGSGVAMFWTRRLLEQATVHARGCAPAVVVFAPTRNPWIRRGSCILQARQQ